LLPIRNITLAVVVTSCSEEKIGVDALIAPSAIAKSENIAIGGGIPNSDKDTALRGQYA